LSYDFSSSIKEKPLLRSWVSWNEKSSEND